MKILRFLLPALCLLLPAPAGAWNSMSSNGNPLEWNSGNPETTWRLSSTYTTNDLSNSVIDSAMNNGMNEWSTPGCTSFNATQGSDVNASPTNHNDSQNTVGFLNSWPAQYGSTTLAVTVPQFYTDGEIFKADMFYNSDTTTWVAGNPGSWSQADLESVAVHEFGHWIGFDHSNYPNSSLNATYSGGISERTLTCDDTEGVCAKYQSSGTACTADRYCACNEGCVNGFCGGVVGDDDDDDDTTSGDDDDDDSVGGVCEGDPESVSESEPNGWEDESDVDYFTPGGGDLTITGSISCGNDGNEYTGDYDWYVIDFPCQSDARFVLDWSGNADIDFFVFDTAGDELANAYAGNFAGAPPTYQEEYGGGRMFVLVVCAQGADTNYQFTFDWTPFTPLGDDDDASDDDDATDDDDTTDDDDASGDDDDATDDDDASGDDDDDDDDDDDGLRRRGCACSSAEALGTASGLSTLALLGVLGFVRRRRLV